MSSFQFLRYIQATIRLFIGMRFIGIGAPVTDFHTIRSAKCPQDQLRIVCAGALRRNNVATKTWKTTDFYDANKSTSECITCHSYRIHVDLPFRFVFHVYFSCLYGINILSSTFYLYVIHIYSPSFLCYDHIDCHFSLSLTYIDLSVISICHYIQQSFILICDSFRFNR